jgi:preprotein translocase subunit SecD
LTEADIEGAEPRFSGSQAGGEWVVVPEFTVEGGERFRTATAALASEPTDSPTRQLAIVIDGQVVSAPQIAAEVGPEGLDPNAVVITIGVSAFPQQEAEDLAAALSSS